MGTGPLHVVVKPSAVKAERWRAINSAMAGISNAIELCSDAGLNDAVDRLLELQRDVLQERERV